MTKLLVVICIVVCALSAGCSSREVGSAACPGSTDWSDAASKAGSVTTIRGPVAGTSYRTDVTGSPTFINLGRDYPDTRRFTVIVWGAARDAFAEPPETAYRDAAVCVTGRVYDYRGIPQMEVDDPGDVVLVR